MSRWMPTNLILNIIMHIKSSLLLTNYKKNIGWHEVLILLWVVSSVPKEHFCFWTWCFYWKFGGISTVTTLSIRVVGKSTLFWQHYPCWPCQWEPQCPRSRARSTPFYFYILPWAVLGSWRALAHSYSDSKRIHNALAAAKSIFDTDGHGLLK